MTTRQKAPRGSRAAEGQVKTSPCRYCGEAIPRTRGAMGAHVQNFCPKAPTRHDVGDMPPGTITGEGTGNPEKKPWSKADFQAAYPESGWVEYTPLRSQRCETLGQVWYFVEGVTVMCPSIFRDLHMASWKSDRNINQARQVGDTPVPVVGRGALNETF